LKTENSNLEYKLGNSASDDMALQTAVASLEDEIKDIKHSYESKLANLKTQNETL